MLLNELLAEFKHAFIELVAAASGSRQKPWMKEFQVEGALMMRPCSRLCMRSLRSYQKWTRTTWSGFCATRFSLQAGVARYQFFRCAEKFSSIDSVPH